jgi:hypothetical protein
MRWRKGLLLISMEIDSFSYTAFDRLRSGGVDPGCPCGRSSTTPYSSTTVKSAGDAMRELGSK